MRSILATLAAFLILPSISEAQILKRLGRPQATSTGSNCPGGVCPSTATVYAPSQSRTPGHWSYPGTIDSHLESEHGVSTAGMTRQQKLDLHDSLHEGTAPNVRGLSNVVVRGTYGSASSSRGYGSLGSTHGYGSLGMSFRVGGRDRDGYVITSISEPSTTASKAGVLSFKSRKQSRQVVMEAADKGLADGSLTANEAQAIRLAARSPRMLNRIEDLILEKAQSSGAYSFALDRNGDVIKSAIDWEAIGDFILKIAPIIFKLIEMFAMDATMPATANIAVISESEQFNYVATVGFEFTGA